MLVFTEQYAGVNFIFNENNIRPYTTPVNPAGF